MPKDYFQQAEDRIERLETRLQLMRREEKLLKVESAELRAIVGKLHPRVLKLLDKGREFIPIGAHEPYYPAAYAMIRCNERMGRTWTAGDEDAYQDAIDRWYKLQCEAAEPEGMTKVPDAHDLARRIIAYVSSPDDEGGDGPATALGKVEAAIRKEYAELEAGVKSLQDENRQLLDLSRELDEHPEEYEGPCLCKLCASYGD